MGRYDEALAEIDRAQTLDPQSTAILADKGLILYLAGQKKEGITVLKNVEAAEPMFLSTHDYLATLALLDGEDASYLAEARQTAELRHDADQLAVVEAAERGFASGGRRGMLSAKLAAQKKLYAEAKIPAFSLAETCGLLGDKVGAFDYLQESYSKHEPILLSVEISPIFAGMHTDPRFRELVRKIGLPPLA